MIFEFDWTTGVPPDNLAAEEIITDAFKSVHTHVVFCHAGKVTVTLSVIGPLLNSFIGYAKCSCGEKRGIVQGKLKGGVTTVEPV